MLENLIRRQICLLQVKPICLKLKHLFQLDKFNMLQAIEKSLLFVSTAKKKEK